MDKFKPSGVAMSASEYSIREQEIQMRIGKIQREDLKLVLLKMVAATTASLRTNFNRQDR